MLKNITIIFTLTMLCSCEYREFIDDNEISQEKVISHVTTNYGNTFSPKGGGFILVKDKNKIHDANYVSCEYQIIKGLEHFGYYKVDKLSEADYLINFSYDVVDAGFFNQELPDKVYAFNDTLQLPCGIKLKNDLETRLDFNKVKMDSSTIYARAIILNIINLSETNKIAFTSNVVSYGTNDKFNAVSNYLINAMFKHFPGLSGETVNVIDNYK